MTAYCIFGLKLLQVLVLSIGLWNLLKRIGSIFRLIVQFRRCKIIMVMHRGLDGLIWNSVSLLNFLRMLHINLITIVCLYISSNIEIQNIILICAIRNHFLRNNNWAIRSHCYFLNNFELWNLVSVLYELRRHQALMLRIQW